MTVKNGSNTERTLSLQEHHYLGVEKLARYNYPDALSHFLKTVTNGKYFQDLYHLAKCMERLKMFDEFFEVFAEDRLEKNPIPFMWGALGDIYYYKHDEKKAMECYHKEVKNMEKDFADKLEQLEYNASYAKSLAKIGKYKRAFKIMDRAIRKDSKDYNNWYVAGWIAHKAKVYGQALKLLDIAIDLNLESVVTMVELSEVHEKLGNMTEAKYCISEAYKRDTYWWKIRDRNFMLNSVKNGSNTERTLSLQEHHDLGKEKLSYYNYPDALKHFIKTVKDDKYDLDWYSVATCMERLKMFDQFIDTFPEDGLEKFPRPYMWGALGDIYHYKHDKEKAMECYRKELKNMEKNFADKLEQLDYNAAYAKTLGRIGKYGRAMEIVQKSIRKDPYESDNWYVGGWISNQAELYEQALLFLDTSYELNRECPVTMVELSEVHEKLGNMFLAKDYILQAYQIDSYWWKTRDRNFILNPELY